MVNMDAVFKTEAGMFNYRVAGVVMQNGCVLLHKNVDDRQWALPGGRVSIMEQSNIALKREFKEELGVDVKVDRFLWSTENFFNYRGKDFHEIGFYYFVTLKETYEWREEAFYGLEGERLIYKWIPLAELKSIDIQPEFLKESIKALPSNDTQHIVIKDDDAMGRL